MGALSSTRGRALLGWLVLLAAAAAALLWRSPPPAGAQVQDLTSEQRAEASGYYASSCARCHAADGTGGRQGPAEQRGPRLTDRVSAAYVDLVLRTGRMPPAGDPYEGLERQVVYDGEERELLVTWMTEEFGLRENLPDAIELGSASRGQDVFNTNCAQCHGNAGAGGIAGGGAYTPNVNQYDAEALAEAIRVGPFEMPAFDAEQISDSEIGDIAAYMEEVRHEQGTPLGLVELNPVFASGFAALMTLVVVVSLFWIAGKPIWLPNRRRAEARKST